jgi:hypothetical protein
MRTAKTRSELKGSAVWRNVLRERVGRRGAAGVREHYSVGNMAHRTLEVFNGLTTAAMGQLA